MVRRLTMLLVVLMLFVVGAAYGQSTFWVGSVYNDELGAKVPEVMNFDWASSGSGNAQGGKSLALGQTFTFRYQSYLFRLNNAAGQVVDFPGLNTRFEYTAVAEIPMVVAAYDAASGSYIFKTLQGGRFYLYHDSQSNAVVSSGYGFDDGDLVVSVTIDADQFVSLVFTSPTQAIGSTILNGQVLSADAAYLEPAPPIVSFRFESTVNFPPLESATTAYFAGRAGQGNLATYQVTASDLALKVDASSKFMVSDLRPGISVAKTCADASAYGQPITFSAKVKNTGTEPLTNITCVDIPPAALTGVPSSLDPGQEVTVTGSYMPTSIPSTDTLTCSGTGATSGTIVSASSSATCTVNLMTDLTVEKQCVDAPQPGAPIVFMAMLTNSGNEPLNNVSCTDDPDVPLTGVPIAQLAPGAMATVSGSYVPTTSGSTDTITCSGTGILSQTVVTRASSATCNIITHPCIRVTKSCADAGGPGQPITFTGTVTNCGDVALKEIVVVDDHAGPVLSLTSLAPGAVVSYSGSYVPATSPATNTVTATGTDIINGGSYSAQASATCNVACTGEIGNFVWFDANANGIQDAGENGIAGATVNIYDSTGTTLIPGQPTIMTPASGAYLFSGLCRGTYVVKVVPPAGYVASPSFQGGDATRDSNGSPATVTLPADNSSDLTIDFGYYLPAAIGDFVWNDANRNGQQDAGEMGIPGVTVKLYNCLTNALVASTTTDANGYYKFENLMPGSYRVEFVAPMGYVFTMPNVGNDATDSDADAFGVTGCYDLAAGQTNLTVDAGLYKPMPSIDIEKYTNGDDADFPTGPKIPVGGMVEWKYVVRNTGNVDLTDVSVTDDKLGLICTIGNLAAGATQTCNKTGTAVYGQYANMGTVTGKYNGTIVTDQDPSHYYGLPDCNLEVTKTCEVMQPPSMFVCSNAKPIDVLTMKWNGTETINIKAWKGQVGSTLLATINNVMPGQEVSVSGYAGAPNDVIWEIFDAMTGTKIGNSVFHISCSDVDMNGPEDCGKPQGDGKGLSGYINKWIFEGMAGNGQVLDCTPMPTTPTSSCTLTPSPAPSCTTEGKPTSLTFTYSGGGCSAGNNPQGGKATCSGSIDPTKAVTVTASGGKSSYAVSPTSVMPGETFTVTASSGFAADSVIKLSNTGGTETLGIHTSCSQSLEVGNIFGSLTLTAFNGKTGGNNVIYTYIVKNLGSSLINLSGQDDKLGSIFTGVSLGSGESQTFTRSATITETTTNVLSVTGFFPGTTMACSGSASATVTVPGTPPPTGCVRSPGYWKKHPDAWPVQSITIGKYTYTKQEAIAIMSKPVAGDKTYTMFPALVAAKLNVASGAIDTCISDTIAAADSWMFSYPVGSGVTGNSSAWKIGEPLYMKLDQYNNGYLCASYCGEQPPQPSYPKISIEKYTNGYDADTAPGPYIWVGDLVKWTYLVKNTGTTSLSSIKVTDDKVMTISCPKSSLMAGESMTCTATGSATYGQYENTGCVEGYASGNVKVTDCDMSHYYGQKGTTGCGTGSPGYWKNHPSAWPSQSISIGGSNYTRDKAIEIMSKSVSGDKTYTMFDALVAAKLNVLSGTRSDCISNTITAAEAWMKTYKLGSKVSGSSDAWKKGEPLYQQLDYYNNGLLCAPHRDSTTERCGSYVPSEWFSSYAD